MADATDADLAEIYGYSTKRFNEQVKNNIEKFDEDFRFQLTSEEAVACSRSKKSALNSGGRGSNIKYNPFAFTEQSIYMLMTVLKGERAIVEGCRRQDNNYHANRTPGGISPANRSAGESIFLTEARTPWCRDTLRSGRAALARAR